MILIDVNGTKVFDLTVICLRSISLTRTLVTKLGSVHIYAYIHTTLNDTLAGNKVFFKPGTWLIRVIILMIPFELLPSTKRCDM